ncbi:MAG: hypothetical protein HOD39_04815 [Verrucomicrobia bacterium]|nr:hypothetical protein [Verrucomicrobiota bacterium]
MRMSRPLLTITGLFGIVLLAVFTLKNFRNETQRSLVVPGEVLESADVHSETKGSAVANSILSGIESQRAAKADLEARHQAHHEALIQKRAIEDQLKAKEAAYWESRQAWMEQFPFEPVYHPEITFDPEVYDMMSEGKEIADEDRPAFFEMAGLVEKHGFLAAFYNNPSRYSHAFEKIHKILTEERLSPDPFIWGWIFTNTADYHRASFHDPDESWPMDPNKKWGSEMDSNWESIAANLLDGFIDEGNSKVPVTLEQAAAIRKRLINEIPYDIFLKAGRLELFTYNGIYEDMLKPGDPLLIK